MNDKEKIEEARRLYESANADQRYVLESLFPELKESEDERIRKELITHFRNTRYVTKEGAERIAKWIAWLEKQDTEMKDAISMDVNSETEWDDIHKFLRMNLDGEKVKLLIIREE